MIFDKYIILYHKTMKIFLANQDLNKLFSKLENLSKYLNKTKTHWEIYSNEGMFLVDHTELYQLHITNETHEEFYYEDVFFYFDYSQITKEKVTRLPSNHISHLIKYQFYSIEPDSKVKFVLKTLEAHDKRYPLDSYFEIEDTTIDPKSPWIMKIFIQFLNLLHP